MPRRAGTFGSRVIEFYRTLRPPRLAGLGVDPLFPYRDPLVRQNIETFYSRFFGDTNRRTFLIGINPGRFGGGTTGIPFTDPVSLEGQCGIPNPLPRRRELSAIFVEALIERFGGPQAFYRRFFIAATSPVGFTRSGKNFNYYDSPGLLAAVRPFIVRTMKAQTAFGARRNVGIVLGTGRNAAFLTRLNDEFRFLDTLVALDHPRFIMQYRRPTLGRFLDRYERVLGDAG